MKDPFHVQVDTELMMRLEWEGLSRNDMANFFSSQLEEMVKCPHNVHTFQNNSHHAMFMMQPGGGLQPLKVPNQRTTVPAWVLRGFYPNTNIFFRMTVVDCEKSSFMQEYPARYYAKVKIPRIKPKKVKDHHGFNGKIIRENQHREMENVVLGATNEMENVINGEKFKSPKCMAPKGMSLLKRKVKRGKRA